MVKDCNGPNWACYGQPMGKKLMTFKTCPLVNQSQEHHVNFLHRFTSIQCNKTAEAMWLVHYTLSTNNEGLWDKPWAIFAYALCTILMFVYFKSTLFAIYI